MLLSMRWAALKNSSHIRLDTSEGELDLIFFSRPAELSRVSRYNSSSPVFLSKTLASRLSAVAHHLGEQCKDKCLALTAGWRYNLAYFKTKNCTT